MISSQHDYTCKDPISKSGHIHRYWAFIISFWEGYSWIHNTSSGKFLLFPPPIVKVQEKEFSLPSRDGCGSCRSDVLLVILTFRVRSTGVPALRKSSPIRFGTLVGGWALSPLLHTQPGSTNWYSSSLGWANAHKEGASGPLWTPAYTHLLASECFFFVTSSLMKSETFSHRICCAYQGDWSEYPTYRCRPNNGPPERSTS